MTVYWELDYFATVSIQHMKQKFHTVICLADLRLAQRVGQCV